MFKKSLTGEGALNWPQDYYKSMPWLAVPYAARSAQSAMASRFKVQGIPALVLIEDGEVINASARGAVMKDPEGAGFPWRGQEDSPRCAEPSSPSRTPASSKQAQRHAGLHYAPDRPCITHCTVHCAGLYRPFLSSMWALWEQGADAGMASLLNDITSNHVGDMHALLNGSCLLCRSSGPNWVLLILGLVFILLKYVFKII